MIFLGVVVYYVFLGLLVCIVARVHKWKIPYAILGMLLLWPVVIAHGLIELCKDAYKDAYKNSPE